MHKGCVDSLFNIQRHNVLTGIFVTNKTEVPLTISVAYKETKIVLTVSVTHIEAPPTFSVTYKDTKIVLTVSVTTH